MSPRPVRRPVRRRRRAATHWSQRLTPATWILLGGLVAATASLALRATHKMTGASARAPQVQVMNGSGIPELAGRAADLLRARGLDVVTVGNADAQTYRETLVLVRRGRIGVAQQVAATLGHGQVLEQRDASLLVDVTVVLGRDFGGAAQEH